MQKLRRQSARYHLGLFAASPPGRPALARRSSHCRLAAELRAGSAEVPRANRNNLSHRRAINPKSPGPRAGQSAGRISWAKEASPMSLMNRGSTLPGCAPQLSLENPIVYFS
jgi:hypothetical protein